MDEMLEQAARRYLERHPAMEGDESALADLLEILQEVYAEGWRDNSYRD